jgi:hypothetical protein
MAAGDERPRVIAEFSSYDGMLNAIRSRVEELQIQGERFEFFAGLPTGYLSKLIGARPVRRISHTSMGPLFCALGVRCIMVEDPAATARLKNRVAPRNGSFARRVSLYVNGLTDRKWAQIQKLGRKARWKKLTKQQRSEIMRMVRHGRR